MGSVTPHSEKWVTLPLMPTKKWVAWGNKAEKLRIFMADDAQRYAFFKIPSQCG